MENTLRQTLQNYTGTLSKRRAAANWASRNPTFVNGGMGQLATYRCSADYLAPSGQLWKQRKAPPPSGRPGTRADGAGPANGAVRVNGATA